MTTQIWQIPGGRLVHVEISGERLLCLKAQRQSKDYVNHYVIPLEPLPHGRGGMALVYRDPDSPAAEAGFALALADTETATAEVGQVVINAAGRFLKVFDTARTERTFCYVDLASGEVRPRQERNVTAVAGWRVELITENMV